MAEDTLDTPTEDQDQANYEADSDSPDAEATEDSDSYPPAEDTEAEGLPEAAAESEEADDADDGVLRDDEAEATKAAWAALRRDQPLIYKQVRGAVTRRFQEIGEEARFVKAYRDNPEATIRMLAAGHNLTLVPATPEPVTPAENRTLKSLEDEFGSEIGKRLYANLQSLAKEETEARLKPIAEQLEQQRVETISAAVEADTEAWVALHPDAKKGSPVEQRMLKIMSDFIPSNNNVTVHEYYDMAYALATRDQAASKDMQRVVDRVNGAAKATATSQRTAPPNQVAVRPDHLPSFKEAARAAREGKRYEFEK